jgi:ABC-type oligopeptide transport system substrate-binding subunit/transcriptional regulator with XRE-family HTH domain
VRGTPTSFGYWVRRRRLALDLTQDALARRVGCSSAAIKKIEHDQRRPSRTMATRLAEALGLAPDQRDRFVAAGLGELAPDRLGSVAAPADPGPAPPWMVPPPDQKPRQVVGRDGELARLRAHLDAALAGHGRAAFVTGEAGQGKTALLTAFAEHAQRAVAGLVVAYGAGTAAGSFGDPYLAVRDVFRMLVADPHAAWRSDQLTADQADRLWRFAPVVARVVREVGPHLLDVLVPAHAVRQWLGPDAAVGPPAQPGREHVVAEVTDVLRTLAAERPLLLLLDDMQWSDTASAELLFHLSRRVVDTRVLVVCAYRASEVAEDGGPAASAVRRALQETRRGIGDAHIDLDDIQPAAGRALCRALLDLDVPDLDPGLHDEFYRRTHGHPLFVRELVRELTARGDLIRGAGGGWTARAGLEWSHVPARIAAVIGQRLDRLGPDERALLDAAAIEGEQFTAETAARVAGVADQPAYRLIAQQLERTHGLVRETGTVRAGGRALTRYQFGHALFQRFIYDALGEGARRRGHGQLAAELEALYAGDLEPVVPRLAHHYAEAGDAQRAVPYLIQAGDRARLLYAHDEATAAYQLAAGFLRELGDRERLARTVMKIGLTHQTGFDHDRAQAAFDEAFTLWAAVARTAPSHPAGSTTLRLVWQEPESLDPTMGGYTRAAPVVTNLFSGLVSYDEDTNVVPDVAARWEIADGGRRYVFHLRHDVMWSDGRPVTAHDFVFTYRRALDPATGAVVAPALLDAVTHARDVHEGRAPTAAAGIHAADDHTLVIELSEPTSYFIYNLAYYVLLPVPQHAVEAHGADWCRPETIVSNGPYRVAEWEHGRTMVLDRSTPYHGTARGNVSRVVLDLGVPDEELEMRYLADQVDVLSSAWFTPYEVIDRLRRRLPGEYSRRERFVTVYYWTDPGVPPVDDRRLRRAMALAVDRDALMASWGRSLSGPGTGGLVPPGMPGHVPGIAAPYDPARAAELVAEVARDRPLAEVTVLTVPSLELGARLLCEGWRAIGIPVRAQRCSTADFYTEWTNFPGPKAALGGWVADYPDPDTFLRVCVDLNLPGWRDDRYRTLLERAARTTDPVARLAAYEEAERILADDAHVVPLFYEPEHLMLKPWVSSHPSIPVKYPGFWKDIVIGASP